MKSIAFLFFCTILSWPSAARPDSAPMVMMCGVDGASVVPIRNDKISMTTEVVSIDCRWTKYRVKADFWLKNTTDEAQELQMGFPIDYDPMGGEFGDEVLSHGLKSVRIEWEGRRVCYSLAAVKPVGTKDWLNRHWVCWVARFKPQEVAHHRVSYTFPMSNVTAGSHCEPAIADLKYILKSGAAWRGTIGSAIIRIRYGYPLHQFDLKGEKEYDLPPEKSDLRCYPQGYMLDEKKKTVTWEFRNFEPNKDIFFAWRGLGGAEFASDPDFESWDKEQPVVFEEPPMKPVTTARSDKRERP